MIIFLDNLIFGNGNGLKTPYFDDTFYWLSGELYTFGYGLGAQLHSFQWTHPKPGEKRILAGREFVVFQSHRSWCRVQVSWTMINLPEDLDRAHSEIRKLKEGLQAI